MQNNNSSNHFSPKGYENQGVERLMLVMNEIKTLIPYLGLDNVNILIEETLGLSQSRQLETDTRLDQIKDLIQIPIDQELETLILNNDEQAVENAIKAFKEAVKEDRVVNRSAFLKAAIRGRWTANKS